MSCSIRLLLLLAAFTLLGCPPSGDDDTADDDDTNVTVNEIDAGEDGGGLCLVTSHPGLENLTITGNTASHYSNWNFGGGMRMVSSNPTVTNVRIAGNYGQYGGGLELDNADPTLTNVTIDDNSASYGGGIDSEESAPVLINVTITNNYASGSGGGGIYVYSGYPVMRPILSYGNIWNNDPDDITGMADPTGSDGNIAEDPELLDTTDPDPLFWDLHLAVTSPLIGAGDPSILDPDGSPSDIGAYGGPGAASWDLDGDGYFEWWLPGTYDVTTSPGMDCADLDPALYPGSGC